jgi:hypothetical protein
MNIRTATSAAPAAERYPDLDRRIELARQQLLTATTWMERAERWKRLRTLLVRRNPAVLSAPGPEHASVILKRLEWEFLLAWQTRRARQ